MKRVGVLYDLFCIELKRPELTPHCVFLAPWQIGLSRGFAFVEFISVEIAKKWIDNQQVAPMGKYKGRKLSIIIPVNGNRNTNFIQQQTRECSLN